MDYLASNPELWNRQLDSGAQLPKDDAFDDWLNGYLAEVLPSQSQLRLPAQMPLVPEVPGPTFPWQAQAVAPPPGHDIGSSTSGETTREQALLQAQTNPEQDPDDSKTSNRAARIADKNRRAQKRFREREKQRKATLETQVAELSARLSAVSQEKARLESRNTVLEKVVKLKDEYIADLESRTAADEDDEKPPKNRNLHDALCKFYAIVKGKPSKFENESSIPMEAIHSTHKAYIDELAKVLMEGADNPSTPAHARMCQLIKANRDISSRLAVSADRLYMGIRAEQVMPGASSAKRPEATHWKTVVDTIGLTEPQKEAVLAARNELLSRMRNLIGERQALVSSLQDLRDSVAQGDPNGYPQQMQRQDALERLQRNLKEEYRAAVDYEVAFFNTILTPLQQARMQVASYPWPTDSLAICNIVAEESNHMGQGGQQPGQADFMALLTGLPDRSPFRALATPMPVG